MNFSPTIDNCKTAGNGGFAVNHTSIFL